ncbi:MAG TPA: hypothetical protein VMS22_07370 [Candidatus Eisenbacteria bacterium]|nr:hypothetical protein [Candidatus Eisenbacteria bacterium]
MAESRRASLRGDVMEGIAFKFARANRPVRVQVERRGLGAHLDRSTVCPSVHAALEAFLGELSGAAPGNVAAVAARQEDR